jgi:aspartyl-tRNA(Asn)/glutamyl-tRNA(Gln) amidotransferase subunit C
MLSEDDVRRIARLARIELAAAEVHGLRAELNGILGLIDQMRAVDTSGVEPMSHPQPLSQRLREDRVAETDQRERFQAVAPQVEDGLYLVPRVIE